MIKFLSKFLAKRYVEKHKADNLKLSVTNLAIRGIDFYSDMILYVILYGVVTAIVVLGIPTGICFLTHYSIGLTILTFFVCFFTMLIFTIRLVLNIGRSIREDINLILKNYENR